MYLLKVSDAVDEPISKWYARSSIQRLSLSCMRVSRRPSHCERLECMELSAGQAVQRNVTRKIDHDVN